MGPGSAAHRRRDAALRPGHESGVCRADLSPSSLRAQRSNPESLRGKTLDCFAALAMTEYEATALLFPLAFES
ncbi:hypothetical protein FXB38_31340 [Bradyrhizobium cytisi]|uniref:Uncharacterized protein n=1 Tax=Bradyrhizobium cytisi TaxID=515489 RepID=A0A5S4W3V6_9BRAD|nr:hypothetical protein FXB38_31340 [Bradyrhizobium cytisi]